MKKIISLTIIFFCFSVFVHGQTIVEGICRYADTNEACPGCNIIAYRTDTGQILSYTSSDSNGRWVLKVDDSVKKIKLQVTGFHIQTETLFINDFGADVLINVKDAKLKIKESKVQVRPITQSSDTIAYNVSSFRNSNDRTIADVLEKMPGIDVDKSGGIKYQGKSINKFYIEGLDLLGSMYGVATKNVSATDIVTVEVYENHQPIRIMEDYIASDDVAINLILKEEVKGSWNGSGKAGVGYKPVLWEAEATSILFAKNFQSIAYYKGNNTGLQNFSELKEQVRNTTPLETLCGISPPFMPTIDASRYLDMSENIGTANALVKLKDDMTLRVNAAYGKLYNAFEGLSSSTYNLGSANSIEFVENYYTNQTSNRAVFESQFVNNSKKYYLSDKVRYSGEWSTGHGSISSENETLNQLHHSTFNVLSNELSSSFKINNTLLRLRSVAAYQEVKETFSTIREQKALQRDFFINNRLGFNKNFNKWDISANVHLDYRYKTLISNLTGEGAVNSELLYNDTYVSRADLLGNFAADWTPINWLDIYFNASVGGLHIAGYNHINNTNNSEFHFVVKPSISAEVRLNNKFRSTIVAKYEPVYDDDILWNPGYIMKSNKIITRSDVWMTRSHRQTYAAQLKYTEVLHSLFCNFNLSYIIDDRDNILSTSVSDGMLNNETIHIGNQTKSLSFTGEISKGLDAINGVITLNVNNIIGVTPYIRQGNMMDGKHNIIIGNVSLATSPTEWLDIKYDFMGNMSNNSLDSQKIPTSYSIVQGLETGVNVAKKLWIVLIATDYINSVHDNDSRNSFFLDCELKYPYKRFDFILSARNILNAKSWESSHTNMSNSFTQYTTLLPPSVMLKIRFSLR